MRILACFVFQNVDVCQWWCRKKSATVDLAISACELMDVDSLFDEDDGSSCMHNQAGLISFSECKSTVDTTHMQSGEAYVYVVQVWKGTRMGRTCTEVTLVDRHIPNLDMM